MPIPEWSNSCSSDPACAPAAYVIAALPATLTIKVSILCDDPSVTSIHIQAVENPAGSAHILGRVQAMPITLHNGKSDLVAFQLPDARTRITNAGVSVSNITWQWQFSTDGQNWTDFQQTHHRIYTVIDMPQKPWKPRSNKPGEIHVPWTEVLDQACKWAIGAKHVDTVADGVTRNVYKLGETLVQYNGAPSYARRTFNCTKFLQLVTQGSGKGQTVNCGDCATVVSTFSNVLGAKLSQSTMGADFRTNPIRLIGSQNWRRKRFGSHEVAWKENFTATDRLFDACLQIDSDGTPDVSDPNHDPLQPTNLVFDTGQTNSYKFCLFASGECDPKPNTAQQRDLGDGSLGFPKITDLDFLKVLKERYDFSEWEGREEFDDSLNPSLLDLHALGLAFQGWEKLSSKQFVEKNFSTIVEVLFKRRGSSQEFVEITVFEAAPEEKPNEFLLQLMGHFEVLDFTLLEEPIVGNISFVAPEGVTVLFKRGNFVAAVRSVGRLETTVVAMAAAVDRALGNFKPSDVLTMKRRDDMQTKTDIDKAAATARAVPKHKLAEEFSVFINASLEDNGIMDLKNMDENGVLTGGKHHHGTAHDTINGEATKVVSPLGGASFVVSLHSEDNTAFYNGLLVFDKDDKLTIVGGYCFRDQESKDLALPAQDEGVWVITKP